MARAQGDAPALYREHCVACHGEQRLGGMGPALLPESLQRVRPAEAKAVITRGRTATQMPGFADRLSAVELRFRREQQAWFPALEVLGVEGPQALLAPRQGEALEYTFTAKRDVTRSPNGSWPAQIAAVYMAAASD